jgi:hypothetical protein
LRSGSEKQQSLKVVISGSVKGTHDSLVAVAHLYTA